LRICAAGGVTDLAELLLESAALDDPPARHRCALLSGRAVLAELRGELAEAADLYAAASDAWEEWGSALESSMALVGSGRCLLSLHRPVEAAVPLKEARDRLQRLGAAPALAEVDELLEQATPQVS